MSSLDIDRAAPVIVRQEVTINAPIDVVWRLHTDVGGWTSWRSDVDSAELQGKFQLGSVFHWVTAGLSIDSTIHEVETLRRTVWGGPAQGITGIHVWSFTPDGAQVHVVTEESWSGAPVEADAAGAHTMLDQAIATWLRELKRAAEDQA